MKLRFRALAVPTVALAVFLCQGCSDRTNEEELKGKSEVVPHKEGTPDFKSYSEAMQYQAKQAKAVGAKGAPKKSQ
jgi:hypothetical protein